MARNYQNRAWRRLHRARIDLNSIQGCLTALTGLIFLTTWIGAAIISNTQGFRNAQAILEREAALVAELVLAGKSIQLDGIAISESDPLHSLQVWEGATMVAARGPMLPDVRPYTASFSKKIGGEIWVFAERCNGARCVVYGASHRSRHQNLYCLLASIFGPLFLILALGFGATVLAIRHALNPLNLFAGRVEAMDLERADLHETGDQMREFAPLVEAINTLGDRVRGLLERERMFLGSCAHEIRTPLAGLIGQLQLVGEGERLDNARVCAARTARVAEQFLTFASSKSLGVLNRDSEGFDLCETVRDAIAPFAATTEAEIEMTGLETIHVEAHAFAVAAIASNLVQNALKYGKRPDARQKIHVQVSLTGADVTLAVEDNGFGLTEVDMRRALEEFERLDPRSTQTGAGLGLCIVNEIASQYGGSILLSKSPRLGGLKVQTTLPIVVSPTSAEVPKVNKPGSATDQDYAIA